MKRWPVIFLTLFTTGFSAVRSQTLSVHTGGMASLFPAELAGEMPYASGQWLTVKGHTFLLTDIDSICVTAAPDLSAANACTLYDDASPLVRIADSQTAANGTLPADAPFGGISLKFSLSGITYLELESVDANALAGTARTLAEEGGEVAQPHSIITYNAPQGQSLVTGTAYLVPTLPCDVYGGYRLSIYRDGQVADYYGVHQTIEAGKVIAPLDLDESELDFRDLDAPFVEEERPALDKATKEALAAYQSNPTEENKQALLEQMGIRYDKVVARKKAKLRELEREAKTQSLIDEMQAIVDEMVANRDIRLEQQFLRLIDPRTDDDPADAWLVLRGASAKNAYIAYAPVTNAEYAAFKPGYTYAAGTENYPVVNVTLAEAAAYADWLSAADERHAYRLPTEEEWILAAGHMPKDVVMNSDHIERGLTAVDAYAQTTGACGGIDFWGNCWEWTTTQTAAGWCIVKGGSWDSSRDACRTEYSDDARDPSQGYPNVGFRLVRVDL